LEAVLACPICGGPDRELTHAGLSDRVFGCAPGEWNLYRCATCGTGYLDPRPNAATIALAYASYFTHNSAGEVGQPPRSAWRRHRTAQRNAYLNCEYGYHLTPATSRVPLGLSTDRRQRWDKLVDYLRFPGPGARLLDVGCGNGRFLLSMRAVGWEVSGVEPDPRAAAEAASVGLDVRTGLLQPGSQPDAHYDAVTLNHVLEHFHHPLETMRLCREILKPGGTLFVATPNFAAAGHRLFGPDWFPLDPPRHLVLFTPHSLRQALETAGLEPEPAIRTRLVACESLLRSMHIRLGSDPMRQRPPLPLAARIKTAWLARQADRQTRAKPELTEELVLLAHRPA
jgi:2-polyprenyl-3-methyl-5-hydroxy-6-metoxy-1,4-benzoquinol methylase